MDAYHHDLKHANPLMTTYQPSYPAPAISPESPDLLEAQRRARSSGRTLCRAFCIGGLIMIGVIGMGLAVILYLCLGHKCYFTNRHLISTAPLGKVLTISQVASHVAPITIPLSMSLASYHLAARWMKDSVKDGSDRPSPMQFGLLLSIYNSANMSSLASSLRYFLGFGQSKQQKAFPSPSILRRSVLLLFILLATAYLISGSDSWLHVTSEPFIIESSAPYTNPDGSLLSESYGRAINGTKCEEAQASDHAQVVSFYGNTCGQISGGSAGDGLFEMPGIRALSNSSDIHRIVFADDRTAIVVPYNITPSNVSYTASSIGIKTSCKTVTKDCLSPDTSGTYTDYGPNAFLNLKCNSETNFNATHDFLMKALDDTGNAVDGFNISSNPFRVGAVITSVAYYLNDTTVDYDKFVGNTGWFLHGNNGAWNVLTCDMAAVDVMYTYKSSTSEYIIKSSTPSSVRDARAIITYGLDQYRTGNPVASAVDGAGIQTQMTYEEAYALELSKETIALGADMYITQNTTDISREIQVIGTRIDLIPLTVMLGAMVIYGCIALVLMVLAAVTVSRTPYVRLAAAHLTDPLVTVHALYGPKDVTYTWQDKPSKKFGTETGRDRLNIGEFSDHCGRRRFTVQRSDTSFEVGSFGK